MGERSAVALVVLPLTVSCRTTQCTGTPPRCTAAGGDLGPALPLHACPHFPVRPCAPQACLPAYSPCLPFVRSLDVLACSAQQMPSAPSNGAAHACSPDQRCVCRSPRFGARSDAAPRAFADVPPRAPRPPATVLARHSQWRCARGGPPAWRAEARGGMTILLRRFGAGGDAIYTRRCRPWCVSSV